MGHDAHANTDMRLLPLESALHEIGDQVRAHVQQLNTLVPRVTALEQQTAAMLSLHADDMRRVQTALGLVQTIVYGGWWARIRWLVGL
jgi:hypothetical protein